MEEDRGSSPFGGANTAVSVQFPKLMTGNWTNAGSSPVSGAKI